MPGSVAGAVPTIAPRIGDPLSLEAPFEPSQFDEPEVFEQFYGRPPRWQSTSTQVALRQTFDLVEDAGAKVLEVTEEHL
jgi:hypothetical protein